MRRFKKAIALVLAAVMMSSTVYGGHIVQAEESEAVVYKPLALDTEESVTFDSPESKTYFSFTPEVSDYYIFNSLADGYDVNPEAYLYVKEQNGDMIQIGYDANGGNYNNFSLGCLLDAGTTYYYEVRPINNYGVFTFDVVLMRTPVQSIAVAPITMYENCDGEMRQEGENEPFYRYNWEMKIKSTITLKSGEIINGTGPSFNYNDTWKGFNIMDGQYESHWEVGHTYQGTVNVMGCTATVEVTIAETPIQNITVQPISIVENTNGYIQSEGTEYEFYGYSWHNELDYVITMKNGDVIKHKGSPSFMYNNEWYYLTSSDDQWYQNPWTVGNTYHPTISIWGYEATVDVSIIDSPVESFVIEPIVLAENTGGYYQYQGSPDEWYYYNWQNVMEYTITMKDGEVLTGKGPSLYYEDEFIWLPNGSNDNQYNSHWYPGNTYNVTLNFLGKSATASISVLEKNETDGFEYMIQGNSAIITGSSKDDTVLSIPSTLGGYPVIGITDLTYAMEYAEELIIPDSVTMLSSSIFEWNYDLKKLTLGSGVSNINNDMFMGATKLEEVIVSDNNPTYCSVDGVVYDKDVKTMVVFPRAKKGAYTVPDTVTDIDCLVDNIAYYDVQLDLGNSDTGYAVEDGVIYNADKTVIYGCDRTKTGKYVMPNTVTTINEGAFQKSSFSEVVVSENVSEIVYAAFSYSMELEKVVLPENLKAIEWGAFSECEKLTEADLPSNLEQLDEVAFYKTGITEVTIPGSVTEVGYSAYKESKVEKLTLEEGIEVIWNNAFADTQITSVVIPNSITHLGERVFADTPLENVTLGTGLEAISDGAFENTNLKTVTIPENVAEIGEYAFANAPLEEAIIKKNDVYIYEGAFYNCPLKEIDLKDGVVAISDYAFYGNDAEGVVIPESVTSVTYKSFAESKKLVSIDVPDNLASIDGTAFDGTAWWDAQADGVVYLEDYLYGYKGAMPENTEITIKDGTKLIADYAFNNQINLKTLTIPSSVTNIGNSSLSGCLELEKVTVAEGNSPYSTNEDGTILYSPDKYPLWRKVESVNDIVLGEQVQFGTSVEDWLADYPWQMVWVSYVDGDYGMETCAVAADMVSGYDSTIPGWQTVTIKLGKFTCETDVYVETPAIESIKISKLPNRTVYDLNQALRTTGMVVKGVSPDGTEFELSEYDVSELDSSEAGTKTITVSYMDFEATFEVEVIAEQVTYTATTTTSDVNLEISVPEGVIDNEAELVVEEKPVEEVEDEQEIQVPDIFKENASQIYDIRFEKEVDDGTGEPEIETVQPSEPVRVSIPVPYGMDGSNCKVYHISDGEPQDMKATYSGGYMVFDAPHFSYYGIVEVTGSSISGVVDYANAVSGNITVTLSKGTEMTESVIAVDGAYNFTGLSEGTYTLKFEKTGHAAREYEVTVGGRSVEQNSTICLIGDVNGDGKVNITDVGLANAHAKKITSLEGYQFACGNVNGDDKINISDVGLLNAHAKKTNMLW